MKKQCQNVRSTKQKVIVEEMDKDVKLTHTSAKHNILVKVLNAHNTVYSNQTGRLPVQSNKGNQLLMVYYDVDANYIDAEPMRKCNHADSLMIKAYRLLWAQTT
jgi:hypothetical protein